MGAGNIEVVCPKCRERGRVPADLAGEYVDCASCDHAFLVPGGAAGGADARREPGARVKSQCPKCGAVERVAERRVGSRVKCGGCGYEYEVLAPTTVEQQYRYRMVQMPPNIRISAGDSSQGRAAAYLEEVVTEYAEDGWEFYRVDSIGVIVPPGCLLVLLGVPATQKHYHVITFRRPA